LRRYEVYFLQRKTLGEWETMERAQMVAVLVSSLTQAFETDQRAELRLVGGTWDETIREWQFAQIFYVDRNSVDLALGEPDEDFGGAEVEAERWTPPMLVDDGIRFDANRTGAPAASDTDVEMPTGGPFGTSARNETLHSDGAFAAAIRRARGDEGDDFNLETTDTNPFSRASEDRDTLTFPQDAPEDADGTEETLRDLGFARRDFAADDDDQVGPPPAFSRPHRKARSPVLTILVLIVILLVLAGGVIGMMVAFDRPEIRPYLQMFDEMMAGEHQMAGPVSDPDAIMPDTTGQVLTFSGVAPALQGRWSPGDCETTYVEFDEASYVIATPQQQPSIEIPVSETLTDDYGFYVRRSPILIEHYQRLGAEEIQMIGRTSRAGFEDVTSDILNKCP
jgi:hypothetical protein